MVSQAEKQFYKPVLEEINLSEVNHFVNTSTFYFLKKICSLEPHF